MVVRTPPMGWNSWNTFGGNINEELVKTTADAMVNTGLRDAGYNYLVIDDCWSEFTRDENHRLVPSKTKFPNGMKAVADYVHSKDLNSASTPVRGHSPAPATPHLMNMNSTPKPCRMGR